MKYPLWITCGVLAVQLSLTPTSQGQTTHTVELAGMDFTPKNLTIVVGDTVHWVWIEGFHNVVSGVIVAGAGVGDGNFRSGDPVAGASFDFLFDQAFLDGFLMPGNLYPYYCFVHSHADMSGTVTVVDCLSDADCDDGNGCTNDSCDTAATCQNVDNTNTCDDGKSCTTDDGCSNGSCAGTSTAACCTTDADCDDQNPCTDDSCDANTGCQNVDDDTNACDDGDSCTENDACASGVCAGTPSGACCDVDADCDDGDGCSDDVCVDGLCKSTFRSPCCTSDSQCNDENPCTDDSCQEQTCFSIANDLACDDGVPCTADDVCFQGICAGTPSVDGCCSRDSHCDDGDECTSDTCVSESCSHTAIAGCESSSDGTTDDLGSDPPTAQNLPGVCGAAGMISGLLTLVGFVALRLRGGSPVGDDGEPGGMHGGPA